MVRVRSIDTGRARSRNIRLGCGKWCKAENQPCFWNCDPGGASTLMEGPCRDLGSRNGSRSLIVRHIVHLKTFNVRGQRTVESQVMHLPVTSSSESGVRRGCFCGLFDRGTLTYWVSSLS